MPQGEIFAVIGPNGAGKTTLFNMIAGAMAPDGGSITFAGRADRRIAAPMRSAGAGMARTFQIVRPFPALSVEDNVIVGALQRQHDVEARERAHGAAAAARSVREAPPLAATLTLPDRKRLEVARALATEPQLLLLDEVMAGLRPTETDRMVAILRELNRDSGLTILLIEHVMRAVMALASRVLVLDHGTAIAAGPPEAVVRDPAVVQSYLGAEAI